MGKIIITRKGALAIPGLKKTKTNQKNPEKLLEKPPKIHTSQGRHTLNDGGSHLRVTARTTPNNGPPQQRRANTTL